jgi:hypothetical protein
MGKSILGSASRLVGCCIAIAGCSETGTAPGTAPQPGAEQPGPTTPGSVEKPSLCPACSTDEPQPLGGETSEFDGGRAVFGIVSSTPRPLSDPSLAPWFQRVEGEWELPFRWRERFLESGVAGYEESTSIVVSVRVLGASDVQFEPGAPIAASVRLDLSVDLHTTDGALQGTFLHTVDSPSPLAPLGSNDGLSSSTIQLRDFRGSLDLALDPEREVAASLIVDLLFSDQGLRGRLATAVRYQGARTRHVLEGSFPDDGCGLEEWPVSLDAATGFEGDELRTALQSVASTLNAGSMSAGDLEGSTTEVALELGEPEHVCQYWPGLASISAPLHVRSHDIDLRQQARVELRSASLGAPRGHLLTTSPYMANDRLVALTGVQPTDVGAGVYIAPIVQTTFTETGGFSGVLSLDILDGDERRGTNVLGWCGGDGCE